MKTSVCKSYTFSAAHRLPNHPGLCKNLHGHNYRVEVEVEDDIIQNPDAPNDGMVADFSELDAAMARLLPQLDHQYLNEVFLAVHQPPTAENVALWFWDFLRPWVHRIRVWETDKAWAEVRE